MKKLLVLSAATFCLAATINAQNSDMSINSDIATLNRSASLSKKEKKEQKNEAKKLEKIDASYQAKQQFFADFGTPSIIKSERTPYFDEITFIKDGALLTAFYDADANLVGTMADKTFEDLPKDAQEYINRHYNYYTVKAVRFFDDNEYNDTDMNFYDLQFSDEDSYFVELERDGKAIVLHVNMEGSVAFFCDLK